MSNGKIKTSVKIIFLTWLFSSSPMMPLYCLLTQRLTGCSSFCLLLLPPHLQLACGYINLKALEVQISSMMAALPLLATHSLLTSTVFTLSCSLVSVFDKLDLLIDSNDGELFACSPSHLFVFWEVCLWVVVVFAFGLQSEPCFICCSPI